MSRGLRGDERQGPHSAWVLDASRLPTPRPAASVREVCPATPCACPRHAHESARAHATRGTVGLLGARLAARGGGALLGRSVAETRVPSNRYEDSTFRHPPSRLQENTFVHHVQATLPEDVAGAGDDPGPQLRAGHLLRPHGAAQGMCCGLAPNAPGISASRACRGSAPSSVPSAPRPRASR